MQLFNFEFCNLLEILHINYRYFLIAHGVKQLTYIQPAAGAPGAAVPAERNFRFKREARAFKRVYKVFRALFIIIGERDKVFLRVGKSRFVICKRL